MVSYEEAIRKPFTDFKKLIIGIILSIIPIVNFTVVTGFAIESSGLGKTRPSGKMPEWKDWMYLFVKGLAALGIKIVYMIPAAVVIAIGIGMAIGDVSGIVGSLIAPELMSQVGAGNQQVWYALLPVIIRVAPIIVLGLLLSLIAAFLTPVAVLNYVKNKRFSAAFDLAAIAKKALTGKYVLAWLAVLILGIVLGAVLSFIPIVGPAVAFFIVGVVGYSLYGQVYREV